MSKISITYKIVNTKGNKDRHPKSERYTKTPKQINGGSTHYPQATHQTSINATPAHLLHHI